MGRPVGFLGEGEMYAAMGGLTDMTSMVDGIERE